MTQSLIRKTKINELFDFDEANCLDFDYLIGTDEAGRGPGAGPVFAAAVCFKYVDDELFEKLSLLNDSKKLTEAHREELYDVILKNSVYYVQSGSVEQIEKINILNTSLNCMKISCEQVQKELDKTKNIVLVDGNKKIKNYTALQKTVVKGDGKSAAIAAASILAKVSRDRFMDNLAKEFPQYGWDKNKGYLTAQHVEAIKTYGITKWHRKKFLRNILEEEKQSQLSLFGAV